MNKVLGDLRKGKQYFCHLQAIVAVVFREAYAEQKADKNKGNKFQRKPPTSFKGVNRCHICELKE